jgi:hypothetical protein
MKFSAAVAIAAMAGGANAFVAPQSSRAATQLAMSDFRTSVRDDVGVGVSLEDALGVGCAVGGGVFH